VVEATEIKRLARVSASYERCLRSPDFIADFYQNFTAQGPHIIATSHPICSSLCTDYWLPFSGKYQNGAVEALIVRFEVAELLLCLLVNQKPIIFQELSK
jgi:hypothetical protein